MTKKGFLLLIAISILLIISGIFLNLKYSYVSSMCICPSLIESIMPVFSLFLIVVGLLLIIYTLGRNIAGDE